DQTELGAHPPEDLVKLVAGQIVNFNLVGDAPKKRLVPQLRRLEVAGKSHKQIEGNLKLFPARKVEKIDAAIQGNDPAIQQRFRTHQLPPEIVHDQHTIVRL